MTSLSFPGTFSKSPLAWGFPADTYITKAHGSTVTLNDGLEYLDWVSGLGSNLLGYGSYNREFILKLSTAISLYGGSLSLPHKLEYDVAERLSSILTLPLASTVLSTSTTSCAIDGKLGRFISIPSSLIP